MVFRSSRLATRCVAVPQAVKGSVVVVAFSGAATALMSSAWRCPSRTALNGRAGCPRRRPCALRAVQDRPPSAVLPRWRAAVGAIVPDCDRGG